MDKYVLSKLISEINYEVTWKSFSPQEWDTLCLLAGQEGVAPLLYWKLSKAGEIGILPDATRKFLRNSYASTWMQNQKIIQELSLLLGTFQALDIKSVVLKGACYVLTIYPDIGMRPMGDLDILVPAGQFPIAVQAVKSMGYEDLLPEASTGLRDLLSHEVLLQKAGAIPLEIHHSLVADKTFVYAVPMEWFWEQTKPLDVALAKVQLANPYRLTPTAQLLYAAAHAMLQHGGNMATLSWFYDLDRLIRVYEKELDWVLLVEQAKTFEWGSALYAALTETHDYFDTPIPTQIYAELSVEADRFSSLVLIKNTPPSTLILAEYQKLLSLNWTGRLRLVPALVFPSLAYMRWRYQFQTIWALPYYYMYRWWGIFKDGLRTLLALQHGSKGKCSWLE